MDLVATAMQMDQDTKETGSMTNRRVMALSSGLTAQSIAETIELGASTDMASSHGQMVPHFKEGLQTTKSKAKALISGQMGADIQGNGLTTKWKVRASLHGLTAKGLRETSNLIKDMGRDDIRIQTVAYIEVSGLMDDIWRVHLSFAKLYMLSKLARSVIHK
jgi:hypothetical protein